jgi:hypothetical protein
MEGMANGGDTANNASTINGAAVPSVGSSMGSFDEDFISAAVVGGDGNSFVKEAMEFLDVDSFMVATSGNMDVNAEHRADSLEKPFEGAAIMNNSKLAEVNLEKNFLDKEPDEIVSGDVVSGGDRDKSVRSHIVFMR